MTFREIIKLHPQTTSLDRDARLRCIDECLDCAAGCTACAGASQSETDVQELVRVIRLCLDCAEVCRRCKKACDDLLAIIVMETNSE